MPSLQDIVFGIFTVEGPDLSWIMLAYPQLNPFENKDSLTLDDRKAQILISWFYTFNPTENGSPYDLCTRGKQDHLTSRLIALAQGV